jgi:dienelactone hydrolase
MILAGLCAGIFPVLNTAAAAEPVPVKGEDAKPLPGTQPLTLKGDIASQLVVGVDKFLVGELEKSVERRARFWKRDTSSPEAYVKSIQPNRERLAHILGVRDKRVVFDGPELVGTTAQAALVGRGDGFGVFAVRWPAFGDVHGEGLLLVPTRGKKVADVVAIPDADQTPEQITGLAAGVPAESQYARRLAESGCRVLVPVLIDRRLEARNGRARLTSREFLYRSAFELGRHLIGYEVQKVLAAVDWFTKDAGKKEAKIGVIGWGEGGLIAMYAAALDQRIQVACISGYFDNRKDIWQEPIDRNVCGLLEQFGDAEIASLIAPRALIVEAAKAPELTLPGQGGAPARLVTPDRAEVGKEMERARTLTRGLKPPPRLELVVSGEGKGPCGTAVALIGLLDALSPGVKLASSGKTATHLRKKFDPSKRMARQIHEIDRHSRELLHQSSYVRKEFMKKLDTGSLAKYEKSTESYRRFFADEVIGRFDYKLLPPNARSRKAYEADKWTGYEVVLDVFPDVIAYGILLLPKDLKPKDKRPVVVCQHGLEGRPQHVIGKESYQYYKAFAARLAERGFITFAPQNLYIFQDRFRTLQRKANPLKKTLFSIITPQHQQIINWLKTLPNVDGRRIAFYGLSYGGKTAMRVPALVTDYCLSICSADFNEWVWKNASTRPANPYSYIWGSEYEIFEFDLGSTFNYAEMAALIAPRPFMVERGHFDGVAPDETVGYEFAKVRFLYQGKLGIGDRCAIEWFAGPHTINGKGTFDFLHKHLKWAKR